MSKIRVSQIVLEPLITYTAPSPTTVSASNVGVSQLVLEALMSTDGKVRISQIAVEVLYKEADTSSDTPPETGGGGVKSSGYAG